MHDYEITFQVPGSGAGIVKEVITAASDYNARRLLMARYPNAQIINSRRVD